METKQVEAGLINPARQLYQAAPMIKNIFFLLLFISGISQAQQPIQKNNGQFSVPFVIEGEDTIPVYNLHQVDVVDSAEYIKNLQAYYRLRFNVIKVYPYARLAAVKLNEMNSKMNKLSSNHARRKYRKEVEEQVRKDFEETIKKMSVSQGKVLIKLIDRETGHTSYDLIKDLKGSFSAFFSQGVAKLFGHNLKSEYDPQGEDKTIENIVQQIERGEIAF
jgi:hypothetical protein